MNWVAYICVFLGLAACSPDETVSGFVDPAAIYKLQSIDGRAFGATATIAFPQAAQVSGRGPCNQWSASPTVPYPWFELGLIRATRATCPDQASENLFFEQLNAMQFAEATGTVLILSNETGGEMVFHRAEE